MVGNEVVMLWVDNSLEADMFKNILVAVDDSPCSNKAGEVGFAFAKETGGKVVVLSVLHSTDTSASKVISDSLKVADGEAVLDRWREYSRHSSVVALFESLFDSSIEDAITRAAIRHGCDLIIMGTHSYGDSSGVSVGVVRSSLVPVMLVRKPLELSAGEGLVGKQIYI